MKKYNLSDQPIRVNIPGKRGVQAETIDIPMFNKDIEKIKDKSIIFYGPSGTGKTTIVYDLMFRSQYLYPRVVVFAPTNAEKRDYEGIIPGCLVYEEFTIETIREVYDQQRAAATVYNMANDLAVLHSLFSRVANINQKEHARRLTEKKDLAIDTIKKTITNTSTIKSKIQEVEDSYKQMMIKFYKNIVIVPNQKHLLNLNLTKTEKVAMKFLSYNPRLLVIFDDAMTEIKSIIKDGKKKNDNALKDFFFKGRWAYITHFYCFQDDVNIDSDIKKNAFYSVFTDSNVASAFFNRTATNFGPQDKARATQAIQAIFTGKNKERHMKMIFSRMDQQPIQYIIADIHGDFKMCSNLVRKYCKSVEVVENQVNKDNDHFKRFMDV